MENKKIEKLQKRIKAIDIELDNIRNSKGALTTDLDLFTERSDKQFLLNKIGVNVRLTGNNKYYWGHQFQDFRKNITKYGSNHIKAVDGSKIGFNKYSITETFNMYSSDLYRFDGVEEMKGFVKGYNALCWVMELKDRDQTKVA